MLFTVQEIADNGDYVWIGITIFISIWNNFTYLGYYIVLASEEAWNYNLKALSCELFKVFIYLIFSLMLYPAYLFVGW